VSVPSHVSETHMYHIWRFLVFRYTCTPSRISLPDCVVETEQARVHELQLPVKLGSPTTFTPCSYQPCIHQAVWMTLAVEVLVKLVFKVHVLAISIPMSMTSFGVGDRLCF
jgi:hypothetical protein